MNDIYDECPHYTNLLKENYGKGADLLMLTEKEFFEIYPDFDKKEYDIIYKEISDELERLEDKE